MERLNKFLHLSINEQILLIKASVALATIRLTLLFLPLKILLSLVDKNVPNQKIFSKDNRPLINRIVWAVDTASNYIPKSGSCLPKSLAAKLLLAEYGYESNLHIGVAKNPEKRFEAHAWIESEGKIFFSESDSTYYTPLVAIEKKA